MDSNGAMRRAFLRGAVIGGTGTAVMASMPAAQAAGWTSRTLPAARLQIGDLISGPAGRIVRVHSLLQLPKDRVRIRYTNPETTGERELPLDPSLDRLGVPASRRFVVLARGIGQAAVRVAPAPADRIDGGRP